jgi:hypothetical protein
MALHFPDVKPSMTPEQQHAAVLAAVQARVDALRQQLGEGPLEEPPADGEVRVTCSCWCYSHDAAQLHTQ